MPEKTKNISRRLFLKGVAAAGGLLAAPYVLTSAALGAADRPPASDRIVMGGIGLGGRGSGDLDWLLGQGDVQFVSICDVAGDRRLRAKNMVDGRYGNKDCKAYIDMRELLAEGGGIDAMLIATGDRWHALAACLAMKAG